MKKLISLGLILFTLSTLTFAKSKSTQKKSFFDHRYFEIKTGLKTGASNNAFSLNDILVKNLVIDLRKMADLVPQEGFIFASDLNPDIQMNLNIKNFSIGVAAGFDGYNRFIISKDLFDFFGYGNEIGEPMDVSFEDYGDVYAYVDIPVGFKIGYTKLLITPSLFLPILSVSGDVGSMTVNNTEDGAFNVELLTDFTIYTPVDINSFETSQLMGALQGAGVDLSGEISFPVSSTSAITINGHLPIVPGHINYFTKRKYRLVYDSTLSTIFDADTTVESDNSSSISTNYYVNRPLKWDVYYDYLPFGKILDFTLGAGVGIYHPFLDSFRFYPEYYAGAKLNIADILQFSLSTEYTNQVFIHQFGTVVNIRLLEVDAGISMESSTFIRSFSATGLGAYTYITIGF